MRDGFHQLIGDRVRIRRAIPAIAKLGAHGRKIATGERVLGLRHGADQHSPDGTRMSCKRLRQMQWSDDLAILCASGRKYSSDVQRAPSDLNRLSGARANLFSEIL